MNKDKIVVPFEIRSSEVLVATFDRCVTRFRDKRTNLYLSPQTLMDLKTAFMEASANAIKHAQEIKKRGVVTGQFYLNDQEIGFSVVDHGRGFAIDRVAVPNLFDPQSSGRGVFMMKQLGDVVTYKKSAKKNILTFKRHLVGQNTSVRELDLFYDLSEAMIRNANLSEVYELILNDALALFHVERASILIYDEKQKHLRVVASRGIDDAVAKKIRVRPGEGVSGYVFQHGRSLLMEDVQRNKRGIEQKKHYKTRSFISAPMICSPLRFGERPVGVINLTDRLDGKQFTKKDLKLLSTIANQAMTCLHMRDLVNEIRKNEGIRREMENVRRIQESYLPHASPKIKGWDVAGACKMAQAAGGDYFDYFIHGPHLFVVVADVAGHDTSSALTMVNFRSRLSSLLLFEQDPARILTVLNAGMYDDLTRLEQFVSCLLLRINTETGEMLFANAGHYPPMSSSLSMASREAGLVLGVDRTEKYEKIVGRIEKNEAMLLFTDGVVETVAEDGKLFGLDRLQQRMKDHAKISSTQMVQRVIDDVDRVRGAKKQADDVTVVVVKRSL